ncbi:hypothetical protein C8Q75DRAFT_79525 [Abortiporus biennis]|nr:hypothetical protein C8Q75DRAFT_79525 [Abortiporus biennis]
MPICTVPPPPGTTIPRRLPPSPPPHLSMAFLSQPQYNPQPQPSLHNSQGHQPGNGNGHAHTMVSSLQMNRSSLLELFTLSRSRALRLILPSHNNIGNSASPSGSNNNNNIVLQTIKKLSPALWRIRLDSEQPQSLLSIQGRAEELNSVWMYFDTHEEARTALPLTSPTLSLVPALESDLEYYQNWKRIEWSELESLVFLNPSPNTIAHLQQQQHQQHQQQQQQLSTSSTLAFTGSPRSARTVIDLSVLESSMAATAGRFGNGGMNGMGGGMGVIGSESYNLSSNPPNPKMSFRAGDWMCGIPNCGAHNFGRNSTCIRCGTCRSFSLNSNPTSPISPIGSGFPLNHPNHSHHPHPHHPISPRFIQSFAQAEEARLASRMNQQQPHQQHPSIPHGPIESTIPKISSPCYPILTPSGKALSAGGRVRNVSSDPLAPCIMYWPDNEPLPERGQVRPLGSTMIQYPPIINTGNKGAAEKQPGDWVCSKCNYLNWRRRKVCQTCFPYAEGNGDSIPTAVQAERISLLRGYLDSPAGSAAFPIERNSPPHVHVTTQPRVIARPNLNDEDGSPIYQTNGGGLSTTPSFGLLPSFLLQDVIHNDSPAHSPATTSISASSSEPDADLSLPSSNTSADDHHHFGNGFGWTTDPRYYQQHQHQHVHAPSPSPLGYRKPRSANESSVDVVSTNHPYMHGAVGTTSSNASSSSSIWKLDGDETKHLRPDVIGIPHRSPVGTGAPSYNVKAAQPQPQYQGAQHDCMVDLAGKLASGLSFV